MDYKKSTVNAFTVADQEVTADGLLHFDDGCVTGCSTKFQPGGTTVSLVRPGLYLVEFHATVVDATTAASVQLLRNGEPVPGTLQSSTANVSFATVVEVRPTCCAVDNCNRLAVQNSGDAATYQNANLVVVKLA